MNLDQFITARLAWNAMQQKDRVRFADILGVKAPTRYKMIHAHWNDLSYNLQRRIALNLSDAGAYNRP